MRCTEKMRPVLPCTAKLSNRIRIHKCAYNTPNTAYVLRDYALARAQHVCAWLRAVCANMKLVRVTCVACVRPSPPRDVTRSGIARVHAHAGGALQSGQVVVRGWRALATRGARSPPSLHADAALRARDPRRVGLRSTYDRLSSHVKYRIT